MSSLKRNYCYNLIYQIVTIISPLITAPYIARVLGVENIGRYSYTNSIVSYIVLFATLGTTVYAQREISFQQGDKTAQTKTFFELLLIRVGLGVFGFICALCLVVLYKQYAVLFAIQSIELLANMVSIDWFYAGNEEFKITMKRNLIIRVLNIICIFIFVRSMQDFYKYVLIIVLGNFIGNASLWIKVKTYLCRVSIDISHIKKHFQGSMSVFVAQVAASIYSMLDKTMIGLVTNSNSENGYYEQALKIVRIVLVFVTAFGTVIMPRVSKAYSNSDSVSVEKTIYTSFNYMWMIAIPMTLGLMVTAQHFVPWFYGDGYEKSIVLIQILSLLLLAIGVNNILGVQYLMSIKKEAILTYTVLLGAILNVILNAILIREFASIGAAISSVMAETAIAIAQLCYVRKNIDIKNIVIMSKNYWISGGIMVLVIELLKYYFLRNATLLNTLILFMIGVAIYSVMLTVLRDKFFLRVLKK